MGLKLGATNMLLALGCAIIALVFLNGCRANKHTRALISTNLSISSYAQARQHADPNRQSSTSYYFPTLEIYNDAGVLLYRSHESMANSQLLKKFPNSVRDLTPQDDAPHLAKILDEIPDFKAREQEIVGKGKLVILSVALESCGGCSIQEQALDELRERLSQQQLFSILEIKVAHP